MSLLARIWRNFCRLLAYRRHQVARRKSLLVLREREHLHYDLGLTAAEIDAAIDGSRITLQTQAAILAGSHVDPIQRRSRFGELCEARGVAHTKQVPNSTEFRAR